MDPQGKLHYVVIEYSSKYFRLIITQCNYTITQGPPTSNLQSQKHILWFYLSRKGPTRWRSTNRNSQFISLFIFAEAGG